MRPVSVCVGEYDWLFPDKNKITITKTMTLTVQAYKSPVMNFEMTEKIQLGCKNYMHTLYIQHTYFIHIIYYTYKYVCTYSKLIIIGLACQ